MKPKPTVEAERSRRPVKSVLRCPSCAMYTPNAGEERKTTSEKEANTKPTAPGCTPFASARSRGRRERGGASRAARGRVMPHNPRDAAEARAPATEGKKGANRE